MSTSGAAARFSTIAAELRPAIDAALAEAIEQLPPECPDRLRDAMAYSLLAPGKRLRPMLVVLACEACGGRVEQALPAACAVEMVHVYSLVHDDLPAMDDDDLRRGRPTNHKVYGEALAILAGDALLTLAFETLAGQVDSRLAASGCAELGRAAGAIGMVGGQTDDILAEQEDAPTVTDHPLDVQLARLESIHARKTGAMFLASLRLGGLAARADGAALAALDAYSRNLGLAFQIADDLLDVEGDQAILGKRVQKDTERGKLTFPGLLGAEESRRRAERLVREACAAIAVLGPAAERLATLAEYVVERDR